MISYSYNIANDTLNGIVNEERLDREVRDSSIAKALDYIQSSDTTVTLVFKEELLSVEVIALNDLVRNHTGEIIRNVDLVKIDQKDIDTDGVKVTTRFAPPGYSQRVHEIEFMTSTLGGNIHDKDLNNNDYNWSGVSHYELDNGNEILMVNPTQNDLDTKCIRTDFWWMPDVNYMILSGFISQLTNPGQDVYFWGLMVDLDAALGGPQVAVLDGGMNLHFLKELDRFGLRGVSGSRLFTDRIQMSDGTFAQLPAAGLGSNRIRFIFRHAPGFQHRVQVLFELFRE